MKSWQKRRDSHEFYHSKIQNLSSKIQYLTNDNLRQPRCTVRTSERGKNHPLILCALTVFVKLESDLLRLGQIRESATAAVSVCLQRFVKLMQWEVSNGCVRKEKKKGMEGHKNTAHKKITSNRSAGSIVHHSPVRVNLKLNGQKATASVFLRCKTLTSCWGLLLLLSSLFEEALISLFERNRSRFPAFYFLWCAQQFFSAVMLISIW